MKKAYRQQYSFASGSDAEKYEIFLKQQILRLKPNFYGVAHKKKIQTQDGPMFAVHLSTAIEDPNLETIAECWINNQIIFLWRDRCWAIAAGIDGKQLLHRIVKKPITQEFLANAAAATNTDFDTINKIKWQDKTVVLYPIGTDPI